MKVLFLSLSLTTSVFAANIEFQSAEQLHVALPKMEREAMCTADYPTSVCSFVTTKSSEKLFKVSCRESKTESYREGTTTQDLTCTLVEVK